MGSCSNNTSNINKTFIIESPSSGDTYVISGLYTGTTLSLLRNDAVLVTITGFTSGGGSNFYTTGATINNNNTLIFNRTDQLSAYTVDLSSVVFSGGSGNCVTDLFIENLNGCVTGITLNSDIIPNVDDTINLGTPLKRFRDINTVSGTSSVWISTNRIESPELRLGLDSSGNTRTITANNSIIQNDTLLGGSY